MCSPIWIAKWLPRLPDGADVIDLAKGNPDAFPADFIREVAKKAVDDPANARYSPFDGKPSFLQAAEQLVSQHVWC